MQGFAYGMGGKKQCSHLFHTDLCLFESVSTQWHVSIAFISIKVYRAVKQSHRKVSQPLYLSRINLFRFNRNFNKQTNWPERKPSGAKRENTVCTVLNCVSFFSHVLCYGIFPALSPAMWHLVMCVVYAWWIGPKTRSVQLFECNRPINPRTPKHPRDNWNEAILLRFWLKCLKIVTYKVPLLIRILYFIELNGKKKNSNLTSVAFIAQSLS